MAVVWGVSIFAGLPWSALAVQTALIGIGAAFVLTRPDGPSGK
jgi:hypothetical protein